MEPSLANLARATGRPVDEVAHLLACTACSPTSQCDENPTLLRAALAAYRGRGPELDLTGHRPERPVEHTRVNRRGEVEVGDPEEFRRIRASVVGDRPIGDPSLMRDSRKNPLQ